MNDPDLGGSEGDPTKPLWLVGRDYGSEEAAAGRPFVGEAGRRVDAALAAAQLSRGDVFIDNVVRKQPPGNLWREHTPEDILGGERRLWSLLERYRPTVVVAFGNEAFRATTGRQKGLPPISEARGYFWDAAWGGKVLASVHPAAIDRKGQGGLPWVPYRMLLDADMKKAHRELTAGPLPAREVHIVGGEAPEMWAAITRVQGEWGGEGWHGLPALAYDIETESKALACLGVAVSPTLAFVVPGSERDLVARLCALDVPKVLHNGAYDRYFLHRFCGIELTRHEFDTMLAWHVLEPELAGKAQSGRKRETAKSLRFLASLFTREPFWKDYKFESEFERYKLCGLDCCVTLEIAGIFAKELAYGSTPQTAETVGVGGRTPLSCA